MSKQTPPRYQRGRYKLVQDKRRDGTFRTPFYQIIWYDEHSGRNRSRSTGTTSSVEAEAQLDALYELKEKGRAICHACGQPITGAPPYLLTEAIAAYIDARDTRASISAIRPRLGHVLTYLEKLGLLATVCDEVDEDWVDKFREWNEAVPVKLAEGADRKRTPGTIEASVRQLAAVINFASAKKHILQGARFKPKKPKDVSYTPAYRASIETLAAMFRYCTEPERKAHDSDKAYANRLRHRNQLLRFLQISVSTWARPDAAHDFSTDPRRKQWDAANRFMNLNPAGRAQTKKYRPVVPAARQLVPLLNATDGFFVSITSVRQAWEAMQLALHLPQDRDAGMKLIRRSIAHLARQRLGQRDWIEGKIMLGHHRADTSDLYAPDDPRYLHRALQATEAIIDEIIALAPNAYARTPRGTDG